MQGGRLIFISMYVMHFGRFLSIKMREKFPVPSFLHNFYDIAATCKRFFVVCVF